MKWKRNVTSLIGLINFLCQVVIIVAMKVMILALKTRSLVGFNFNNFKPKKRRKLKKKYEKKLKLSARNRAVRIVINAFEPI